jgi:hypothetical protein
MSEAQRVLVPGGRFVYVGTHPCFVGPFAERSADDGSRRLHKGYRDAGWHNEGPGIGTTGLRHRVGVRHVPLADLANAMAGTGLMLERFAEDGGDDEFPDWLALAALNPGQFRSRKSALSRNLRFAAAVPLGRVPQVEERSASS